MRRNSFVQMALTGRIGVRLSGGGAGDPYPGLVVYDTFTDTDGVSLNAHTPELSPSGGLWTEAAGEWDIQAGRVQLGGSTTAAARMAFIDAGLADCAISAIARFAVAVDNPALLLRYVDSNNYLIANLNDGNNNIRLIQKLGGSLTVQNTSGAFELTTNTDYAIEAVLNGTSIKIYADGSLMLDVTNSNFLAATLHGIYAEKAGTAFDDFQVATL